MFCVVFSFAHPFLSFLLNFVCIIVPNLILYLVCTNCSARKLAKCRMARCFPILAVEKELGIGRIGSVHVRSTINQVTPLMKLCKCCSRGGLRDRKRHPGGCGINCLFGRVPRIGITPLGLTQSLRVAVEGERGSSTESRDDGNEGSEDWKSDSSGWEVWNHSDTTWEGSKCVSSERDGWDSSSLTELQGSVSFPDLDTSSTYEPVSSLSRGSTPSEMVSSVSSFPLHASLPPHASLHPVEVCAHGSSPSQCISNVSCPVLSLCVSPCLPTITTSCPIQSLALTFLRGGVGVRELEHSPIPQSPKPNINPSGLTPASVGSANPVVPILNSNSDTDVLISMNLQDHVVNPEMEFPVLDTPQCEFSNSFDSVSRGLDGSRLVSPLNVSFLSSPTHVSVLPLSSSLLQVVVDLVPAIPASIVKPAGPGGGLQVAELAESQELVEELVDTQQGVGSEGRMREVRNVNSGSEEASLSVVDGGESTLSEVQRVGGMNSLEDMDMVNGLTSGGVPYTPGEHGINWLMAVERLEVVAPKVLKVHHQLNIITQMFSLKLLSSTFKLTRLPVCFGVNDEVRSEWQDILEESGFKMMKVIMDHLSSVWVELEKEGWRVGCAVSEMLVKQRDSVSVNSHVKNSVRMLLEFIQNCRSLSVKNEKLRKKKIVWLMKKKGRVTDPIDLADPIKGKFVDVLDQLEADLWLEVDCGRCEVSNRSVLDKFGETDCVVTGSVDGSWCDSDISAMESPSSPVQAGVNMGGEFVDEGTVLCIGRDKNEGIACCTPLVVQPLGTLKAVQPVCGKVIGGGASCSSGAKQGTSVRHSGQMERERMQLPGEIRGEGHPLLSLPALEPVGQSSQSLGVEASVLGLPPRTCLGPFPWMWSPQRMVSVFVFEGLPRFLNRQCSVPGAVFPSGDRAVGETALRVRGLSLDLGHRAEIPEGSRGLLVIQGEVEQERVDRTSKEINNAVTSAPVRLIDTSAHEIEMNRTLSCLAPVHPVVDVADASVTNVVLNRGDEVVSCGQFQINVIDSAPVRLIGSKTGVNKTIANHERSGGRVARLDEGYDGGHGQYGGGPGQRVARTTHTTRTFYSKSSGGGVKGGGTHGSISRDDRPFSSKGDTRRGVTDGRSSVDRSMLPSLVTPRVGSLGTPPLPSGISSQVMPRLEATLLPSLPRRPIGSTVVPHTTSSSFL